MTNSQIHPYSQNATIQQINEQLVVLALPDGQTIQWAKNLLPESIQINDTVRVIIHNQETEEQERKRLAASLLNIVMNDDQI